MFRVKVRVIITVRARVRVMVRVRVLLMCNTIHMLLVIGMPFACEQCNMKHCCKHEIVLDLLQPKTYTFSTRALI